MQSIATRIRFVAFLTVLLASTSAFAQNIPPEPGLVCQADGNSVHLSWEGLFLDPAIGDPNANFPTQLFRNGNLLVDLAAGDVSYTDENVPAGTYVYSLMVVTAAGEFTAIANCTVTVGGETSLRCSVDGQVVSLDWSISSDILAFGFTVARDGVIIATLDADARSFQDQAPAGDHTYQVSTNNRLGGVNAPDFLIGNCRVKVGTTGGLTCTVNGNIVTLVWDMMIAGFATQIIVTRDNQIIATLPGDAHFYEDHAPPGEHVYTVVTNNAFPNPDGQIDPEVPDLLIGTCRVFVPDGFGIKCSVDGNVVSIDWDDLPIDIPIFGWLVRRNSDIVAQLEESQTEYREEAPAGTHIYTVTAIIGFFDAAGNIDENGNVDENGNPLEEFVGSCQVTVGGSNVPGPRNLECNIAESFPVQVQLSWELPTTTGFEVIVVMRDGQPIAELEGFATFFSEFDPGAGIHVYGVFGILNGVVSDTAFCTVETPGGGLRNELALENRGGTIGPDGNGIPGTPAIGGDTVTVVMTNAQTVQGWSFGVCSDPSTLTVAQADIEGTATAALNDGNGPSFLALSVHDRGVTMGAVIDQDDPADVLTPGSYDLLQIRYEPGPDAETFVPYPVDFCERLGEPPVANIIVVVGQEVIPTTVSSFVIFAGMKFLRSDVNNDLVVDVTDSIVLLEWLFLGHAAPTCMEAADMNGTHAINIADPIYSLTHVLIGGEPPPAPYPDCGSGPMFFDCEQSGCAD